MISTKELILVVVVSICCCQSVLYPQPKSILHLKGSMKLQSFCNLKLLPSNDFDFDTTYYYAKIMNRFQHDELQCPKVTSLKAGVQEYLIEVSSNSSLHEEGYSLQISPTGIKMTVNGYSGFIYALETFSQLINKNPSDGTYEIPTVDINDQPLVGYRGIMIDSARHYLSVGAIKRLIESMALFKLNILHWHIADDQSFPIKLSSHPQLAEGAYSSEEVYTINDVKELIALADKNGVKIIPQFDTPSHVRSWGRSTAWKGKGVVIDCPGTAEGYNGQFNVSNPQSFKLVQDVLKEIDQIFSQSPYLHLGGDEVMSKCWDSVPQIKDFMKQKNLTTYGQLQMYWRTQLKSVLPSHRKVIFWRNNGDGVQTGQDDVLHYWGAQNQTAKFVNGSTSKIIMSQSDLLYLNKGQGFIWGNEFGHYTIWKELYKNLIVFPEGVDKTRILGGVACLWGEVSNEDTLQNNLWMRAASFAGRVWAENKMNTIELAKSLISMQKTLYGMKVAASPITSQFCQQNIEKCFAQQISLDQKPQIVDYL